MKLADIIALAKQGYKPGDIKELLTLAEPETTQTQDPENGGSEPDGDPAADNDPEPEPAAETADEPADDPDYKALFEAEKAKRLATEKAAAHKETGAKSEVSDFDIALKFMNEL